MTRCLGCGRRGAWSTLMILTLLAAATLTAPPAKAEDWYTVTEIRAQTAAGWHETLAGRKGDIAIDVAIEIPDVSKAAAVLIHQAPPVAEEKLAGLVVKGNKAGWLEIETPAYADLANDGSQHAAYRRHCLMGTEPINDQAKGNPLSCQEALNWAAAKLESLTGMRYGEDWLLNLCTVMDASDSETGYGAYYFDGRWAAAGLSMPVIMLIYADVHISFVDEARWRIFAQPFTADGFLYEDMPFCGFDKVKETVREAVKKGKLKSVAAIKLAYTPCGLKDDLQAGRMTLVPTWHIYEKDDPRFPQRNGPKLVLSVQDGQSYTMGRPHRFKALLNSLKGWEAEMN